MCLSTSSPKDVTLHVSISILFPLGLAPHDGLKADIGRVQIENRRAIHRGLVRFSLKNTTAIAVLIRMLCGEIYFALEQKFQMVLCNDSLAFWVIPSVRWPQNSSEAKILKTSRTLSMSMEVKLVDIAGIV